MRQLSAAERVDALIARGVVLYVDGDGQLRARCEPCFAHVLDAAKPSIRRHRAAIIEYLNGLIQPKSERHARQDAA